MVDVGQLLAVTNAAALVTRSVVFQGWVCHQPRDENRVDTKRGDDAMKQVSSSNDWFFVHKELGPDGKPAVSPILAFAMNNDSDVVPLIADGGSTKQAPHQKGTIKFLGQLLEKEAIAAGVIGRWLMLRSSPRK